MYKKKQLNLNKNVQLNMKERKQGDKLFKCNFNSKRRFWRQKMQLKLMGCKWNNMNCAPTYLGNY
jgi:hypothetical protein